MSSRTTVIAEAGVNHNGSLERAVELIERGAVAGADVIKFQTFRASELATRKAKKAEYQQRNVGGDAAQYDMLRALELAYAHHYPLVDACERCGVEFLSTPFDLGSLHFLTRDLGRKRVKISSGDLTNAPFLVSVARENVDIILSTGMALLGDVEQALSALAFGYLGRGSASAQSLLEAYLSQEGQAMLRQRVTLLHCTSEYPTPLEDVNLRAMDTLAQAFQLPVGLSDHTQGVFAAVAAVARGAAVIEKHFTLDRKLPGPDHTSSIEPLELAQMVEGIRAVEIALGSPIKHITPSERGTIGVARKALVAVGAISKGDIYTKENIGVKRAGAGPAPIRYWEFLGRVAPMDYQDGDPLRD